MLKTCTIVVALLSLSAAMADMLVPGIIVALVVNYLAASPSTSEDATAMPPFQAHVDMKTLMQHVLGPAAATIWNVNGLVIDAKASTICRPNRTTTGNAS